LKLYAASRFWALGSGFDGAVLWRRLAACRASNASALWIRLTPASGGK
jgi:hypothetical protein